MSEVHFVGRQAVDSAIVELAATLALDRFGCITALWLHDNLISDDGAAALAALLQEPGCALVELWLGNNRIGPAGAARIAEALRHDASRLTCLGLSGNPLGEDGAAALAQTLREHHRLATADVHGCTGASDGRLLDAVRSFAAFNRRDPTRGRIARDLAAAAGEDGTTSRKEDEETPAAFQRRAEVAEFLAALGREPAQERATAAEKEAWKAIEWKRLCATASSAGEATAKLPGPPEDGERKEAEAEEEGRPEFTIDDEEGGDDAPMADADGDGEADGKEKEEDTPVAAVDGSAEGSATVSV